MQDTTADRLFTTEQLLARYAISREALRLRRLKDPAFPKPFKLSGKRLYWKASDVLEYEAAQTVA
jgi:predicted DNA-binding transcriptional regulator AlpA